MPRLCDLQQAFSKSIIEGNHAAVTAAMAADGSALRSIALYRRLIRNNFVQVLKITYPVLHRLVGDGYFGVLARGYLKHHPSTSGDLFLYGRHLPALLQRLDAPPLLVALARLEWACHEVYQAADSAPLSPDQLHAMLSADPSRITLQFHQTARFLSFPFPVHRVWLALQADVSPDAALDLPLPEEQTGLIVARSGGAVQVIPLAWLDYRLLEALSRGATVASIERLARDAESGFDFTRLMTTLLNVQAIAGISVKEDLWHTATVS
ncbi:MAG: DNA-binding domain-containing protein [Nitrospirota bacterium]|nr:DNA-binding domain-containing protein [Nitrospirota bacterium]